MEVPHVIWKARQRDGSRKRQADGVKRRALVPERLEARRLLAADPIQIGVVYLETDYLETDQDVGSDSQGDRFILSFTGGAPNTQLSELRIRTDKAGNGISVGDPIFDTEQGGRGKHGAHGFEVVRVRTSDGHQVEASAEVEDGGQELVLRLNNFFAGDRLEFTLDVDEVLRESDDLELFNDRLDVITSGQEFQDSILEATFNAPHYEPSYADAVFLNNYGDPGETHGLDLPPDEGDDIDSRPNRSAAAVASAQQTPKPIEISGHVWIDSNLDLQRDSGENMLEGVEIALWQQTDDGSYADTGHRAKTDADGMYLFSSALGLRPGQYRVVQARPADYFSVGAVPGTVEGVEIGITETANSLVGIRLPLGDTSAINYDFAVAAPASLSGYVYRDDSQDGVRDPSEPGIGGVPIQIVPIETIAPQSAVTVSTSADGSYLVTGLAPGRYEVIQLSQPANLNDGIDSAGTVAGRRVGFADNPGDRIGGIVLAGSDAGVEYNFGETAFGSISGYVYLAAPGEDCGGDHDSSGTTPLGSVELELQSEAGETIARTSTGVDGSYTFDGVPIGVYRIVEFTPSGLLDGSAHVGRIDGQSSGVVGDGGTIQSIAMTAAGVGVEYNFCEAAPAVISGYVYQDASNDGNRDAGEAPIAGVQIDLIDASGQVVATEQTDVEGRYQFIDVTPGEYTIIERQPVDFFDGRDSIGHVRGQTTGQLSGNDAISVSLQQGDIGQEYNFAELAGAALFGSVHVDLDGDCELDDDESGLDGVVIRLLDLDGNEVARTTTDAEGQYSFRDLAPGSYTVAQDQPAGFADGGAIAGSAGGTIVGSNRITDIELAPGETAIDYRFCERLTSEILGTVFNDLDGDCWFDSGEAGIGGVRIELYDASGRLIADAVTDAAGTYRFSDLSAGEYTIRQLHPSGWIQGGQIVGSGSGDDTMPDEISGIAIGWGERLTGYNFCEIAPGSISGVVFADNNGDCEPDAGDQLLQGVTIELRDRSGRLVTTTTTDANGEYLFDHLSPGEYEIFERGSDDYLHGGQRSGTGAGEVLDDHLLGVALGAGQHLTGYQFCKLMPSSISGKVWQESEPNGQFEPGDQPIAGVRLELVDSNGTTIAVTHTDASGDYAFTRLRPGTYGIRETQPGGLFHAGQVVGSAGGTVAGDDYIVGVVLAPGTEAVGYHFAELPPAMLSGYVFQDGDPISLDEIPEPERLRELRDGQRTPDDQPLEGIKLELRNVLGLPVDSSRALPGAYADGQIVAITDANGYYEFSGLRPGTYHVYQMQPESYVDGLDTPGTAGGVAVNPADEPSDSDRITIQTLTVNESTDPKDDAILNIALVGGGESRNNNFSEIAIGDEEVQLQRIETPAITQLQRIDVPYDVAPELLSSPAYPIIQSQSAPLSVALFPFHPDRMEFERTSEVSWHLSVINGGFPRGRSPENEMVRGVGSKDATAWNEGDRARGRWTIASLTGATIASSSSIVLGDADASAVAGDFDGNGVDEPAIYVGGQWFVDLNGNGRWDNGDLWIQLGSALDIPVVGDWDGDGKDDIGIFGRQWRQDPQRIQQDPGLPDPANKRRRTFVSRGQNFEYDEQAPHQKRLLRRGNQGSLRADAVDHVFQYGEEADLPVAGDWNGDGIDQIAVYRSGKWMLDLDGDGRWSPSDQVASFGRIGDEPIVGDFNGDGIDEIGVVRGNVWIIDSDGDRRITGNDLRIVVPRENADSQPIVGDFDHDGKDEPGYYDEAA